MLNDGQPLLDRLGILIESRIARTLLVVFIVLSVLPYPPVENALRPLFLLAFGAELAIRGPLLIRRRRQAQIGLGELAFLLIDAAAFVSFLPLEAWSGDRFLWITLLRLSRLLVLIRFARELGADLYSILTRREQLQQFGLVSVAVAALAFLSAVFLTQLDIPHNYDGIEQTPASFWDRLWWSFRQLESADNLIYNLHVHPIVGVLSLALTITGVFVISFIIGIGTNVVGQLVRAERRHKVGYHGHTVVIGPIAKSETLIRQFVRIYVKNRNDSGESILRVLRWLRGRTRTAHAWRLPRMALLGPEDEPPAVLYERGMRWVVYRPGDPTDTEALQRIGAASAKRAILLASGERDADAMTLAALAAFRELNRDAHVFLELVDGHYVSTLSSLGERDRTFPLDVPRFLGLFLVNHLITPRVEQLYRILLTEAGSEMYTHVFLDDGTLERLAALGEDGSIAFSDLAALAERYHLILLGVTLGEARPTLQAHDLVPLEGLVPWINPYVEPDSPKLTAFGARAGRVPVARLRGLIAVGESYRPVCGFARALVSGANAAGRTPDEVPFAPADPLPHRILLVGYGDAVASLSKRLAEIVDDARIVLACDKEAGQLRRLRTALRAAGIEPSDEYAALERGGRLEVRVADEADALDVVLPLIEGNEVDAVVFLAEADAPDPDARTALRMMRLAEHCMGCGARAPRILAEMTTVAKGERVRARIEAALEREGRRPPRITLISTEQIRHYFMVNSAFVPGIDHVYMHLLGSRAQDVVRLALAEPLALRMSGVRAAFAARAMIPLALERTDGTLVVNPPPDDVSPDVQAIFAVASPER